jgi:hypothetical protein
MRPIVSHLIFGAAGFWLPDITLNAFGAESIWRSTVFPTVGFFIAYQFARAIWKSHSKASVAVFMASGVWLFASTAMMIGASFSGGGFANGFVEAILVILLGLLPPYTLIMSVYDASLLGLLITTFLALGAHFTFESEHWILPPEMQTRLKRWYERRVAHN